MSATDELTSPCDSVETQSEASTKIYIPSQFSGPRAEGSTTGGEASSASTSSTMSAFTSLSDVPTGAKTGNPGLQGRNTCDRGAPMGESATKHAKVQLGQALQVC